MPQWSDVVAAFDDVLRADAEAVRRRRCADEARRSFEDWCERAEQQVMTELCAELRRCASALESDLGATVRVECPVEGHCEAPTGERLRFLKVGFGGAEVFVYTSRSVRGLPSLHVAHAVRSRRARFPRMLSVPGYVVTRGPGGDVGLRDIRGPATSPTTTLDVVACRTLDMLAAAALALRTPAVA